MVPYQKVATLTFGERFTQEEVDHISVLLLVHNQYEKVSTLH